MPPSLNQPRRRALRNACLAGLVVLCVAGGLWVYVAADDFVDVCGLFIAVAALVLAIADYFRPPDTPVDAGSLADDLAGTVEDQWSEEADARNLRDPGVLPLSWSASARAVADTPSQVAGTAAGQVVRLRLDGRLDGRFDQAVVQLAEGYGRVPSGRLVVLGEPGAGKTVLAVLLALGLLTVRKPGGPVPVLLAASSWDPVCEPLDEWIVHTLATSHYSGRRDIPRRLLDRGLLLPILDGLDEIPESARRSAIRAINRALGGDRPIVVTCRSAEYEDVIEGGAPVLRRAPVVEVDPVAVDDVIAYLGDIDWPDGTDWSEVFAHLREPGNAAGAVTTALSTPLMVSLTRLVHERGGGDPGDLLDAARFDCRHAVEDEILGRVIEAAYAPERLPSGHPVEDGSPGWEPDKARRWLTFLAQYLHQHRERDLAWWQMSHRLLSPWVAPGIGIGVGAALMVAVLAWASAAGEPGQSPEQALAFGAVVGSGFAVVAIVIWYATSGRSPGQLSLSLRGSLGRLRRGFGTGVVLAAIPALPFVAGSYVYTSLSGAWSLRDDLYFTVLVSLCAGLATVLGLAMAVHHWLDAPPARSTQASPLAFIRQDRLSSLAGALAAGVVVAGTFLLALTLGMTLGCFGVQFFTRWAHWDWAGSPTFSHLNADSDAYITGVLSRSRAVRIGQVFVLPGVVTTLLILLSRAWTRFLIARCLLAVRGHLPWRLMGFLSDARDRGLLRQSGGSYQFRHIRLQEQLVRNAPAAMAHAAGRRPDHPSTEAPATTTTRRKVLVAGSVTVAAAVVARGAVALPADRSLAVVTGVEPADSARSVVFSHDGETVAVLDHRGVIRLCGRRTARVTATVRMGAATDVKSMTFSPDDRRLLVTYEKQQSSRQGLSLWRTDDGRRVGTADFSPLGLGKVSGDGRVLAFADSDRSFTLWYPDEDRRVQGPRSGTKETGEDRFIDCALSYGGRYLAVGYVDGTIGLWDADVRRVIGHAKVAGSIGEVRVGRNGTVMVEEVVETTDATRSVWHTWDRLMRPVREFEVPYDWALSGDASVLARSIGDGRRSYVVEVRETAPDRLRRRLPVKGDMLALSHDGSVLATLDARDVVELWDTRTGAHRGAPLAGHREGVADAAFSDDGAYLATHSHDGTVRIWAVPPPKPRTRPLKDR
ncbi:hypothetical protein [Streptomyces sp. NPDC053079]|uniref:hypothetical protein n=1 Tax=Streptomyces sp. NPDC053079 TaxID=3365697 RepID=UPI0037D4CAC5